MTPTTKQRIGLGLGALVLVLIVGAIGFVLGRSNVEQSVQTASTTTLVPTTTTSTSVPRAVPTTSSSTVAPLRDFPDLFEDLRSSVASVDVVGCNTASQGTAFLTSEDTAYTAWHVVQDAAQIALQIGGESIEASVIGRDEDLDVAILRLATPVADATVLPIAIAEPRVGEQVAAMGHPRGLPLALTVGRVTSMNGDFDFGGSGDAIVQNLIQTDAVVAPGSSGGPLINRRGEVIGIVILKDIAAEGLMYASNVDGVRASLAGWNVNPEPIEAAFCVGSVDLGNIDEIAPDVVASDTEHPEVAALQRTYAVYTQSINSARAEAAFGVLGPAITNDNTPEAWAEGQATSLLWDWRIREVTETATGLQVRSTFTSTQEMEYAFDGLSTCTRWDITHDLVSGLFRGRTFWLIDRSRATEGSGPVDCLDWEPEVVAREQLVLPEVGESLERADRLPAGTVHDWDIGFGPLPEDETAPPVTMVVTVDATDEMFDPIVTVRDQFGVVIGENDDRGDGSLNSRIDIALSSYQVVSVHVADLANRDGGSYTITFSNAAG
ncbi:MAG: serine protease Do [Verrucomicrobiales bacterium]|jgi:serine protease Do